MFMVNIARHIITTWIKDQDNKAELNYFHKKWAVPVCHVNHSQGCVIRLVSDYTCLFFLYSGQEIPRVEYAEDEIKTWWDFLN